MPAASTHAKTGRVGQLTLLGFAIPQVWMYAVNQAVITHSPGAVLSFYLAFTITLGATAWLCRTANVRSAQKPPHRHHAHDDARRAVPWLAALCMAALPLAQLLPAGILAQGCTAVATVLGGIGGALCFQAWFDRYARLELSHSTSYALVSFALAGVVSVAIDALRLLSPFLSPTVLAALCLVGVPLLIRAQAFSSSTAHRIQSSAPLPGKATPRTLGIRQLALVIAELVLFSFVLGLLRGQGVEDKTAQGIVWLSLALRAAFPLLLLAWLRSHPSRSGIATISQAVIIVTAIAFVALALAGQMGATATAVLASLARNIVLVLLTITLLYIAHASQHHPCTIYGIGRGIHAIGTQAGISLNLLAGTSALPVDISANVVLLIVAGIFLILGATSAKTVDLIEGMDSDGDHPADRNGPSGVHNLARTESALDARCLEVAQAHGLTERECEMIRLICRGRSRGYIAQSLGISENTVRYHVRNAYGKLGVHSKQELLTLIGLE